MTPDNISGIFGEGLQVVLLLMLILIGPGLLVGLIVAMFQAATQINEASLSFIPKLFVTLITLAVAGPWMLKILVNYTQSLIMSIPYTIG